jgi:hypothetical protein
MYFTLVVRMLTRERKDFKPKLRERWLIRTYLLSSKNPPNTNFTFIQPAKAHPTKFPEPYFAPSEPSGFRCAGLVI